MTDFKTTFYKQRAKHFLDLINEMHELVNFSKEVPESFREPFFKLYTDRMNILNDLENEYIANLKNQQR